MKDFKIVQRLYWQAYNTEKKIENMINYFKKYKGACDEIALLEVGYCMEDRFIPLEEISNRKRHIEETIARLRTEGFYKIHINIMNIYGHGDNVRKMKYEPDFDTMVGHNGIKSNLVACPNSERFKDYLKEKCKILAKCKPDVIWIDDDVRLHCHETVSYGCFCNRCMEKFSKKTGIEYNREQLVKELLKDNYPESNDIRKQWLLFNREAIGDTIKLVEESVHLIDDAIELGLMTPDYEFNLYSAPDLKGYGEIMKSRRGMPKFRPGSGFWTDSIPIGAIYKGVHIGRIISNAKKEAEFLSEVEGWPYQTLEKTPDMTAFEIASHIGIGGVTGVTINLTECMGNDNREQSAYLMMLHEKRPFLKGLAESIQGHKQIGFYPYVYEMQWAYNNTKKDLAGFDNGGAFISQKLIELGIPLSFGQEDNLGILISGQAAKTVTKDMIKQIKDKGSYIDGEAAEFLLGVFEDKNILGVETVEFPEFGVYEKNNSHPINGEYSGFNRTSNTFLNTSNGKDVGLRLKGAEPLTDLYNYDNEPIGLCGMTVYENEKGGRTAVAGYLPWEHIHFLHKRYQLTEVLDWISGNRMPVKIKSPYKIAQSLWENEKDAVIVLYNISFQKAKEVELYIRYEGEADELGADGSWCKSGIIINNTYKIRNMDPWSVRVLRVKRYENGICGINING